SEARTAGLMVFAPQEDPAQRGNTEIEIFGARALTFGDYATRKDAVTGHQAVADVLTVGAIDADDDGYDDPRFSSSGGPSTFRIGPLTTSVPSLDVMGIDAVSVSGAGYGKYRIFGTSA